MAGHNFNSVNRKCKMRKNIQKETIDGALASFKSVVTGISGQHKKQTPTRIKAYW